MCIGDINTHESKGKLRMSNLRIGRQASNNPTGLTLVASTGGSNGTFKDLLTDAQKEKLGIQQAKPSVFTKPAQAAAGPKIDLVGDAYRLRAEEQAVQKAREIDLAWKEHEAFNQTAREIAQYEKSAPLVKNPDVPDFVRKAPAQAAPKSASESFEVFSQAGKTTAEGATKGGALVPFGGNGGSVPPSFGGAAASTAQGTGALVPITGNAGGAGGAIPPVGGGSGAAGGAKSLVPAGKVIEDVPYEEVTKNKGLWSKFKDVIKGGASKAANWFKGLPKAGKIGCIIGALAIAAGAIYGLYKLFSGDKEEGKPVEAPKDYNPQVPKEEEKPKETEQPTEPDANEPVKSEQPDAPVPAVPTTPEEPEQNDDIKEIKDDVKEVKDDVKEIKDKLDQIANPVPVAPVEPEAPEQVEDPKQVEDPEQKDDITGIKDDVKEIKDDVKEVKDDVKEIKDKLLQQPEDPANADEPKAAEKSDEAEKEPKAAEDENVYTVVKGDCVWNIAKDHLIKIHADEPNYVPTNAEILKHTNEIMDYNPQLHWEDDHYHVMIRPGDKINLVKQEQEVQEEPEKEEKDQEKELNQVD